jgi:hypothetical protein
VLYDQPTQEETIRSTMQFCGLQPAGVVLKHMDFETYAQQPGVGRFDFIEYNGGLVYFLQRAIKTIQSAIKTH